MADNNLAEITAADCTFAADVKISHRTDNKSAPFEIVARTGEAINHHKWGRIVHDLEGMQHKKRIPIDFNHNPNDIVGYGNRFGIGSGDLVIKGALTPYKDNDRATEILFKASCDSEDGGGVPYEASINFAGDMKVERLEEGSAVVNGRHFEAPITIVREWQLRGVALTPYGYDSGTTAAFFSSNSNLTVTVIDKETEMSNSETSVLDTERENRLDDKKPTADAKVVDENDDKETPPEDKKELSVDGDDAEPKTESEVVVDGKLYMDAFGRVQGALYFAEGMSFEDAQAAELKRLRDENAELKKSAKTSDDDLENPLPHSPGGESDAKLLHRMPGEVQVTETVDGNDLG